MNVAARHAIRRNMRAGFHYFDPDTMRYHQSQVHAGYNHATAGTFLVLSDFDESRGRRYYVLLVHIDGNTERVSHPVGQLRYDQPETYGWESVYTADNYARARAAGKEVNA